MFRGCVGVLALACGSTACGSSPYDREWVAREVARGAGHPLRSAAETLEAGFPRGVVPEALGQDDAVATALWNSRRFQVELAQLGFARADLAEAGALPNPTLAFLLPIGPRQYEANVTYPVGALIQMPSRIAAAKIDVERTARTLVEVALDLARDVRIAHAELALAERRVGVRRDIALTLQDIAKLTEARVRAGDASKLETRAARAEAIGAVDAARRAPRDVAIARERLRRLLGLASSRSGEELAVTLPPPQRTMSFSHQDLERIAITTRPDMRASEIAIEAAGERLGWEKAKVLQLFARLDSKPVGSRGGSPNLFLPGAQIDVPIFNWNPGGRGRAEAQIEQATFRYLVVRDDVVTEVRIAREQLDQALASLGPWVDDMIPLLDANVRSATSAFESGAESYLVVLEAVRRSQEARLRVIDLEGDIWRARAALDRAVGRRMG